MAATLLLASESVMEHRLRYLYREFPLHDGNNQKIGTKRERVQDVGLGGDLRPARLTVLLVELVDVHAAGDQPPLDGYKPLDIVAARACGFRTPALLREDWKLKHPKADTAQLVWFSLGDVRDRDRYLQRWIWKGGDYTQDRHSAVDDLPALSPEELAEVAANNHQRQTARVVETQLRLAEETLAQRVARLENAGDQMRREIKQELRIIAERAKRGKRKLGAPPDNAAA